VRPAGAVAGDAASRPPAPGRREDTIRPARVGGDEAPAACCLFTDKGFSGLRPWPTTAAHVYMPPFLYSKFVRGQPGDDHFEGVVISTAGSGKTNGLVAACASLYELATSEGPLHGAVKAILVVFTREARAECVERGAAGNGVTKVTTFHSHGKVYITMWNRAMHKDHKIMAGKDPRDLSAFEPSVVKQKTRLVVSFFFRNFEHGEALTKLYREFVAKVMDLARQKAIGCPQEESLHNTETLSALVEEYNLAPILASSWTGKLNQTEKLQLERKIGDESRRLDFGLKVAASCLDLSIQIGTQLTVDGCTHLSTR